MLHRLETIYWCFVSIGWTIIINFILFSANQWHLATKNGNIISIPSIKFRRRATKWLGIWHIWKRVCNEMLVLSGSIYLFGWWIGIWVIKVRHRYQTFEWYNEYFCNVAIPGHRPRTFSKIECWDTHAARKKISRQPWNMVQFNTWQRLSKYINFTFSKC